MIQILINFLNCLLSTYMLFLKKSPTHNFNGFFFQIETFLLYNLYPYYRY